MCGWCPASGLIQVLICVAPRSRYRCESVRAFSLIGTVVSFAPREKIMGMFAFASFSRLSMGLPLNSIACSLVRLYALRHFNHVGLVGLSAFGHELMSQTGLSA